MNILVATGASGGHVFPALSFLEALKNADKSVSAVLVVSKKVKGKIDFSGYKVRYIAISSFKLKPFGAIFSFAFNFLRGIFQSIFLLIEFRPVVVVGFGSLSTIPLVFFAWLFRIKVIIHEQNVIPGRANKFLAVFCDKILISFADSRKYLPNLANKLVVTGNPIRSSLKAIEKKEALNFLGFNENKFTLLVMGGSQGSHQINLALLKAAESVENKTKLQIIHLAGHNDCALLIDGYKKLNIEVKVIDFLKPMHYAYCAADLVIARSGALSITELINFSLPAILIPYPYAQKHQLANALVLGNKGCALIVNDEDLDRGALEAPLNLLISDTQKLKNMRAFYKAQDLRINAAELLVKEVLSV